MIDYLIIKYSEFVLNNIDWNIGKGRFKRLWGYLDHADHRYRCEASGPIDIIQRNDNDYLLVLYPGASVREYAFYRGEIEPRPWNTWTVTHLSGLQTIELERVYNK